MKPTQTTNNRNGKNNIYSAKNLAFSSVMCALGVVILFIGSVIETLDMSTAAIASFIVTVCMIELGSIYSFSVYSVTSVLSFFLLPNKSVVLIYVMFFGFYPIIKKHIERLKGIFCISAKFVLFNIVILILFTLGKKLLFPDIDRIKVALIVLMNVILFTFDLALSLFVAAYIRKFRTLLQINRYFK